MFLHNFSAETWMTKIYYHGAKIGGGAPYKLCLYRECSACCKHVPSAGQTGTASSKREMELSTCVQTIRYSWYPHYNLLEAGVLCQALGIMGVDSFLTQKK